MADRTPVSASPFRATVFAALQHTSRRLRPLLDATGTLALGRRLVRGRQARVRDPASLILDPPGATGTARVRFDGGTVTVVPGEAIGRFVTYDIPFEQFELDLFARVLRPGDVVLDVGANYGLYSMLAARRIGTGTLHAFEPNPRVFPLLEKNVRPLIRAGDLHLHREAVGDRPGVVRFLCSEDSAYSSVVETGRSSIAATVEVPQTSLDQLVGSSSIAKVDVLKIDVEGFEPEVVAGAKGLLSRPDAPLVLIEIARPNLAPRGIAQLDVVKTLQALGFDVRVSEASLRSTRDLDWSDGGVSEENFIAFKPARADRLMPWMRP